MEGVAVNVAKSLRRNGDSAMKSGPQTLRQQREALTIMRKDRTMADRQLPDSTLLNKLLRYEPETGKLFWRERTPDMFTDGRKTRGHNCAIWNAKWSGKEAFTAVGGYGYRCSRIFGRQHLAHRVIFCMVHGYWPVRFIDHINRDRKDNRIVNLRNAGNSENQWNTSAKATSKTGIKGVVRDPRYGTYRATIRCGGKPRHLGTFKTAEDARKAYALAAHSLHGDFAYAGASGEE